MTGYSGIIKLLTKAPAGFVSQDTGTLVSHNLILRAHGARLVYPLALVSSVSLIGRLAFKAVV